jgi:hypothetical protein
MNRTVLPTHVQFLSMQLQYEHMDPHATRLELNFLYSHMSSMTLHMEPDSLALRSQETYIPDS